MCVHLVSNGEKQDEDALGGQRRAAMLKDLCRMNPTHALTVRALCVSLPILVLYSNTLVAFPVKNIDNKIEFKRQLENLRAKLCRNE